MLIEDAYLLAVARGQAGTHPLPLPPKSLDWSRLIELARQHGLLLFLGSRLMHALPAELVKSVKRHCALSDLHQNLLRGEIERLTSALGERGIAGLFLKGVTLAKQLYASEAHLRATSDIDLLVSRDCVGTARLCLDDLGYIDVQRFSEDQWELWTEIRTQAQFLSPGGIGVELHWRARRLDSPLNRVSEEWLRAGAIPGLDLLLYLADHGGGHGWARLGWLVDFVRLLRSQVWDAQELEARARTFALRHRLLLACSLAERLFEVPSPLPTGAVHSAASWWIHRHLFTPGWSYARSRYLIEGLCHDGPGHALRSWIPRLLAPSPAELHKPARASGLKARLLRSIDIREIK